MAKFSFSVLFTSLIVLVFSVILYFVVDYYFLYEDVFVDTVYGRVKGYTAKSRDGVVYNRFNSIPFAQPPIGHLRFLPPQRLEKWEGTRDVSSNPNYCMQYESLLLKSILGSEDCLYLAVYAPQTHNEMGQRKSKKPVMVFIHGGFFMFGGLELYDANYFMDEGEVLVVIIQYRVGALGFLNTGDEHVTGNMALKDQNSALKWVQENIEAFGGDPTRVVLFGESAGAASVHHHIMSEMSKGLFKGAIAHSGSSFCPWTFTRHPKEQAVHLGKLLNCSTENSKELVSCLRAAKAEDIVATHKVHGDIFFDPIEYYGPSIETKTAQNKNQIFISESPYKKAVEGKYSNKVPVIFGFNKDEGCLRSAALIDDEEQLNRLSTDWNVAKNTFLLFDKGTPEIIDKLWKQYFDGAEKRKLTISDYKGLTDFYSDRYFTKCTREAAILHSRTNSSTYLYYFSYKNEKSIAGSLAASKGKKFPAVLEVGVQGIKERLFRWIGLESKLMNYGVCHCDDLINLFGITIFIRIGKRSPDYEFSKKMIKIWTNFAKYGQPSGLNGVEWTPITPESTKSSLKYLNLGKEIKMINDPVESRVSFWKKLKLPRNLEPELEEKFPEL